MVTVRPRGRHRRPARIPGEPKRLVASSVRFTDEEGAKIEFGAMCLGMNTSEYFRLGLGLFHLVVTEIREAADAAGFTLSADELRTAVLGRFGIEEAKTDGK